VVLIFKIRNFSSVDSLLILIFLVKQLEKRDASFRQHRSLLMDDYILNIYMLKPIYWLIL